MSVECVSVIIPCYNVVEYVEEGIRSIINQTYSSLEIICLDDFSNDGTYEVLNSLASEDQRIKVYRNEKNLGLIGTLNSLVELSNYELLVRMDPDDISLPTRIETLVNTLIKTGADIVSSNYNLIDLQGVKIKKRSLSLLKTSAGIKFTSMFNSPIPHAPCLIKRSLLKENHFDINYKAAEDFMLWSVLLKKNINVQIIDESLYLYRQNPLGMSLSNSDVQSKNHVLIARQNIKHLVSYSLNENNFLELNRKLIEKQLTPLQYNSLINELILVFKLYTQNRILSKNEKSEIAIYFSQYLFFTYFNIFKNQRSINCRFKALFFIFYNFLKNGKIFISFKFISWLRKII